MILVTAHYAAPATCTPRDKQTRFSKRNKIKGKQNKIVPDSNSNLAKSMTHHNQTKELTTWFLKALSNGCQECFLERTYQRRSLYGATSEL
jgi:hypothetical protein